jgi:hypothetical protein
VHDDVAGADFLCDFHKLVGAVSLLACAVSDVRPRAAAEHDLPVVCGKVSKACYFTVFSGRNGPVA